EQHFHYHPPTPKEIVGIPHNLPYSGVTQFVGRDADLKALHEQLQRGTTVAISAIAGMGGIGKTELALQYALRHLETKDYPGGLCWLRSREDVGLQILSFARTNFGWVLPEGLELAELVDYCWQRWPDQPTLLVLDDVQAYEDVEPFLPPARSQFKILMTARSHFGSPVKNYDIQVLSAAASLDLLRSLVADGRIDQEFATAEQLCEWLGYLPLGLELVGRYLARKPGTRLATLWQRLQAQRLAAKALLAAEPQMTATLGVTAAFELSWQELTPAAQQVARLLSLFAGAEIPWQLVQQSLSTWDEAYLDEEDLEEVRDAKLVQRSLLRFVETERYQLHQLLREFFAAKLVGEERQTLKTAVATTMIAIAQQIPQTPTLAQIQAVEAAIPHLKEVATDLMKLKIPEELYIQEEYGLLWVFTGISRFYDGQGLYAEAEPWLENCLTVVRSLLGEQHPAVAASLNNLAGLYESQGRYELAEPLYQQALQLRRSLLGEQHPHVASSLNNLAGLYYAQGRYELAEPLFQQALQLWRSLLGEQHPDVASSLNNLAVLYYHQGRLTEAEPLLVQALAMRQQLLGNQHPDTVGTQRSLEILRKMMSRAT
ncbi:MAG: tetratricopeptide repeat protein, partial [Synechococcales bacterium]|nr:tetratricopeptide repeat protein [Synechococcales bacterium]